MAKSFPLFPRRRAAPAPDVEVSFAREKSDDESAPRRCLPQKANYSEVGGKERFREPLEAEVSSVSLAIKSLPFLAWKDGVETR